MIGRKDALGKVKNRPVRLFQCDSNWNGGFGGKGAASQRGGTKVRLQRRAQPRRFEHELNGTHGAY